MAGIEHEMAARFGCNAANKRRQTASILNNRNRTYSSGMIRIGDSISKVISTVLCFSKADSSIARLWVRSSFKVSAVAD